MTLAEFVDELYLRLNTLPNSYVRIETRERRFLAVTVSFPNDLHYRKELSIHKIERIKHPNVLIDYIDQLFKEIHNAL